MRFFWYLDIVLGFRIVWVWFWFRGFSLGGFSFIDMFCFFITGSLVLVISWIGLDIV